MSAHRIASVLLTFFLLPAIFCTAQAVTTPSIAPLDGPANVQSYGEDTPLRNHWAQNVKTLLINENFDELDSMADRFRREKTRAPGGGWRLREFYEVLDAPQQTDQDYVAHLEHLRKWMEQRPESITARVALATSLTRWAWVARGNGLANTVTAEGWRLFNIRANEALAILQGSRQLRTMCPQWFSEMMTVGLALNWDNSQMQDIYERAIQFEPEYEYFYKSRVNYLLPKWDGQTDDATNFAKEAADKLGGDSGEIMYYRMAAVILKRGNGKLSRFLKNMDWQRIQRGYMLMNARFGHDLRDDNAFAYMAYHFRDASIAQQQFALIGNNWSPSVWRDNNSYERARDWATGNQSWP